MNDPELEFARVMRALDQAIAQGESLGPVGRKERRAAVRSAIKQAAAERRADIREQPRPNPLFRR